MYYYRGIALDYHARTLETSKEVCEYYQKKYTECMQCVFSSEETESDIGSDTYHAANSFSWFPCCFVW